MAKKTRTAGGKSKGRSLLNWLFWPALIILVALAVYYTHSAVTDWYNMVFAAVKDAVGWGIIFVTLALLTLIFLLWRGHILSLFRNWNKWLGAIALVFAAWGILAFASQSDPNAGGRFGLGIIGAQNFLGALRIFGLLLLSVCFIVPRLMLALVKWIGRTIKNAIAKNRQKAAMKQMVFREITPPKELTAGDILSETEPTPLREKKPPVKEKELAVPAPRGLRQIAQDVWKKYGQSAGAREVDGWRLPPIDILDDIAEVEVGQADNTQRARKIEEALRSYGVVAKVVQINAGPTVTQFGVEPGWDIKTREIKERDKDGNIQTRTEEVSRTRVKVDRITSLSNDLALALAASSIRIEAPVPGKAIIGIEVPNTISSAVSLRGVIETSVFQKLAVKSKMILALGKGGRR